MPRHLYRGYCSLAWNLVQFRRGCEGNGMTLHNYLLFVSASIVLVLVPGPDMVYLRRYRTRRETEERCFSGWKTQSGIEPFLKTGAPQ